MRGLAPALLLGAIFLVPASAAWGAGSLDAVGTRDAMLDGVSFTFKTEATGDGSGLPDSISRELSVAGERIRVEVRSTYRDVDASQAPPGTVPSQQTHATDVDVWRGAQAAVAEARSEAVLFLAGDGRVSVGGDQVSLGGHDTGVVGEGEPFAHDAPPLAWNVSRLHRVTSGAVSLQAEGDFVLSFYDWDLRVWNRTADAGYWSGERPAGGPLSPGVDGQEHRRVYLHVTNGTLSLPLEDVGVGDLFVAGATLDAASAVLDVADGDDPVNLSGPVRFGLGPVEAGVFEGRLLSSPAPEPDDGTVVDSALGQAGAAAGGDAPSPPPADAQSTVPWVPLASASLFALAVASLVAWRVARMVRLHRAMRDGDYGTVASATGMEDSKRFGAEVVVARVVALVKAGDLDGAASLLERRGARLLTPVSAYLWACVHAGRGEVEEARSCVIKTIMADPSMAAEVASNSKLKGFLSDFEGEGYS